MSDVEVAAALRSNARLVVIEAPAGCGKTYQGAEYARELLSSIELRRVLIVTHTHSAADVFSGRAGARNKGVDVRTIDSLITQIASAYHASLGLPKDVGTWVRQGQHYEALARKVADLVAAAPMIMDELARRYEVLICDEHQDASADQHAIVMAFHAAGGKVRIFGDPMQMIYGGRRNAKHSVTAIERWEQLKRSADICAELKTHHRWLNSNAPELGTWVLHARYTLKSGGKINIDGQLPNGLNVLFADSMHPPHVGYLLPNAEAKQVRGSIDDSVSVMVLAHQKKTVTALRAFFGRRLPIWEGHMREYLSDLASHSKRFSGDPVQIARGATVFLEQVAVGCSASAFSNELLREVGSGCTATRTKRPKTIQDLAKHIVNDPSHKGVAGLFRDLYELSVKDPSFSNVHINNRREYFDAIELGKFDDPDDGFAQITQHRVHLRPTPAKRCISTIHKAKGMECESVLVVACNGTTFSDSPESRALLYVAISRASKALTLVLSRRDPTPLISGIST